MDIHERIGDLAADYLEGRLPEDDDRAVMAHLADCADCAAFVQARIPSPEPFWKRPGLLRFAKGLSGAVAVGVLILLGAAFQTGDAVDPPAPADEAIVHVEPPTAFKSRALAPAMDAAEEPVYGSRMGGRALAAGGGSGKVYIPAVGETRANPFQEDAKLVRNADLQIQADSFEAAQASASAAVAEENGFLSGAETQRQANGKMSGTLTARVPPDRFERVLARFRELGTVISQNVQTRDVTKLYLDLEARLASKRTLADALRKILATGAGSVKELMEVEVQVGRTLEEIEAIVGEMKYYDNVVGHSTIVLRLSERNLGRPVEVVETLEARLGLSAPDVEAAYARAQKILLDAGGQVVDASLSKNADGDSTASIQGRVDAGKFPDARIALLALGHPLKDAVNRRRAAQGERATDGAVPVRTEWAVVEVSLSMPPLRVARRIEMTLETADVDAVSREARRLFEEAGGSVSGGGFTSMPDGSSGRMSGEIDVDRMTALQGRLSGLGAMKRLQANHDLPSAGAGPARERAALTLTIESPAPLVAEEAGLTRAVRSTFQGSLAGILWSVERLLVGLCLALPWAAIAGIAWLVVRRIRRRRSVTPPEAAGSPG